MSKIQFFSENIRFKLPHPIKTKRWILEVIRQEKSSLDSLNYIFCDDAFLLKINSHYLKHKTLTDIITFDYSANGVLSGEIYISIERVKENAVKFKQPYEQELHRVIIHGVLHLLGYQDKTPIHKRIMRKKEDAYLSLQS
jgi:rRNA maturation RNase YbeY